MLRQHPVVYASTLSNLMSTYLILCPRTMYMSHKLYVYAPQTIRIHSIESHVHELCTWVTNYTCTRHKLHVSTLSNLIPFTLFGKLIQPRLHFCFPMCPRTMYMSHKLCVYASQTTCMRWMSGRVQGEVGGWGRDPKKCTGRDWGMGSSTI